MCPGNIYETFEENLKALKGWEKKENIRGLIFEPKDVDEVVNAKRYLYKMNITRATLFPGIEGFAKSLAVYPPEVLDKK